VSVEKIEEAPLQPGEGGGLAPDGDGWFIVNVAEAAALDTERFGAGVRFEGASRFPELGINVRVLQPGQPASMYHRERAQEAFLVLRGECLAIVEGQERRMRAGDLLHLPPGTAHVLVGAGDAPSAVLMVGARKPDLGLSFPADAAAARYGASVERDTDDRREAYAGTPRPRRTKLGELPW
jgi:uncharacterized cupin superfamily protein